MKNNSLARNLFVSVSSSIVFGFCVMSIFWLITGMKYNLFVCFKVFIPVMCLTFALLLSITICISVMSAHRRNILAKFRNEHGYSDEYYQMVIKLLGGTDKLNNSKRLSLAAAYSEGERCDKCTEMLKTIDFSALNSAEQNEYFNIMLYNSLLKGDIERTKTIYQRSFYYFERALFSKNSSHIMHTLGVYFYAVGELAKAENYFVSARVRTNDLSLKGDCNLYLGLCYLKTNRREYAKQCAIDASKEISGQSQKINLRKLMILIEKAYGIRSCS